MRLRDTQELRAVSGCPEGPGGRGSGPRARGGACTDHARPPCAPRTPVRVAGPRRPHERDDSDASRRPPGGPPSPASLTSDVDRTAQDRDPQAPPPAPHGPRSVGGPWARGVVTAARDALTPAPAAGTEDGRRLPGGDCEPRGHPRRGWALPRPWAGHACARRPGLGTRPGSVPCAPRGGGRRGAIQGAQQPGDTPSPGVPPAALLQGGAGHHATRAPRVRPGFGDSHTVRPGPRDAPTSLHGTAVTHSWAASTLSLPAGSRPGRAVQGP